MNKSAAPYVAALLIIGGLVGFAVGFGYSDIYDAMLGLFIGAVLGPMLLFFFFSPESPLYTGLFLVITILIALSIWRFGF